MHKSLILNYIDRNINRLYVLDYVLLGIAALAILYVLFLAARGLYRMLMKKKSGVKAVLPSASLASQFRELVRQAGAERVVLERLTASGVESFTLLQSLYRDKQAAGAKPEELAERLLNYTLSMRRTVLQMTAAAYAFGAFERCKALLKIYAQAGVEGRLSGAQSVQDIADRLEFVRQRVIEPVLSGKSGGLPDPRKFLEQFSVPGPEEVKVEVFDREMDDLCNMLKSSIEKVVR